MNPKGVSILTIIIVLWLAMANHNQAVQAQIAAAEAQTDPNHPVEVYFGDSQYQDLQSMADSLAVTIYPEDKVETLPPPGMGLGSKIVITRATKVNVTDAKVKKVYRTWQGTVGDLLKEKNIELLGKDSSTPGLSAPISYNMNISITRVAEVEVKETETIAFKTVINNDPSRYRGELDIVQQKGINGQKVLTYQITRQDGVEISRKLINSQTTPVQNRIVLRATKLKIKETISGRATWYDQGYNAASHLWPRGTHVRVTNPANGKSIETVIDDYMESDQSVIDLRLGLFQQLANPYGDMPTLTVDWVLN